MNYRIVRSAALGLAAIVLMASVAPAARAQEGGGPPSEETVAELYQTLQVFQSLNRTRAMLGLPPLEGEAAVQLRLLKADFDENIMPGLMFAEEDCFFAEVPLGKALNWLRTVQLLGLDEDWGPLWEEAAVVQESLHTILVNCHKELYEKCVLDDGDPDAALLPSVTRSLALMDGDPIYDERNRRCAIGWTGYLKITETLHGNMSQSLTIGPASQTVRFVANGTREFQIDLLNKTEGSVGSAEGRVDENMSGTATSGRCVMSTETTSLKQTRGSGDASLRKNSSPTGALTLSFGGPTEEASLTQSTSATYNMAECGGNYSIPGQRQPFPAGAWPGLLTDQLGDPLTEVISGSRTMIWIINAAGAPTPAREGDSGGVSRVPAIPGLPPGANIPGLPPGTGGGYALLPWSNLSQPMPDAEGERPTIRMELTWELVFGGSE